MPSIGDLIELPHNLFDNAPLLRRSVEGTDEFTQYRCRDRIGFWAAICNIHHDADQWQRQQTMVMFLGSKQLLIVIIHRTYQTASIGILAAVVVNDQ